MSNEHQQYPTGDPVRASVAKVMEDYVVAYPLKNCGDLTTGDSVTFSLSKWQCGAEPQYGQIVELFDTALYQRGWRALSARPVTSQNSSQQKARRV